MAVDITALYCCLDDFCQAFADWEAHQLIPAPTKRQRSGKLSRSEMLFIMVLFHLSPYKNFKTFPAYQPIDPPLTPFGRLMQNRLQRAGNRIDASDHAGANGRRV